MKLKYILGVVLSAFILTGCSDDQTIGSLGSIALDKTYVSIPESGGDVTVRVTASQDWKLADVFTTTEKDADGNKSDTPSKQNIQERPVRQYAKRSAYHGRSFVFLPDNSEIESSELITLSLRCA